MKRIGEMGLHGITGRLQVGLEVALREAETVPAARAKAVQLVEDFRQFLAKEPLVRLVDENPFDVAVNLRTTLGPALEELGKALTR